MDNAESRAWRVCGRVQGVGFRYFVVAQARSLGLAGWTLNREDGSVEVQAHGPAAALGQLEAALRAGPPHSAVASVSPIAASPRLEGLQGFTIEHRW